VVTHLARNADAFRGMVEARPREVTLMYPSPDVRADGSRRRVGVRPAIVRADLRGAHDRLIEAFGVLSTTPGRGRAGVDGADDARFLWCAGARVEVHHAISTRYEAADGRLFVAARSRSASRTSRRAAHRPDRGSTPSTRVVSTDHERAWRIGLHGDAVPWATTTVPRPTASDRLGLRRGHLDVRTRSAGRRRRHASGDLGVLRLPAGSRTHRSRPLYLDPSPETVAR